MRFESLNRTSHDFVIVGNHDRGIVELDPLIPQTSASLKSNPRIAQGEKVVGICAGIGKKNQRRAQSRRCATNLSKTFDGQRHRRRKTVEEDSRLVSQDLLVVLVREG